MILEKYGDSLPEKSDPLSYTDVYGGIERNEKTYATTEVKKTGQR